MNIQSSAILPHLTFDSGCNPQHSVIWLHGLGADGHDFLPLAEEIQLAVPVRFLFPHAPLQAVSLNAGAVMRSWYDISLSELAPERNDGRRTQSDERGLLQAQQQINELIAQEHTRGVAYRNIFLAGFSQGGALALFTALRFPHPLGGLVALSTYWPLRTVAHEALLQARSLPIFMAHGRQDAVVAYSLGVLSKEMLLNHGYILDWREYAMPHSVCAAEVRDIETWLNQRLLSAESHLG